MPAALPWPAGLPDPDFSSAQTVQAKILENTFGDGYTQRAADGLNSLRDSWANSWTNLRNDEKYILENLLRTAGGWQSFFWIAPGEFTAKKWTCKEWKFTPIAGGYWGASATFQQSFDL